ncbi:hypothetical protein C2G38_2234770, partial [Gigaspora rosea]
MDSKQLRTLGYNYELGIGVEKDEKKAFEYYMKAAELGNPTAMQDVSLCYYYGIGVEINYQKSFEYCKKSADLGNAMGMSNVGDHYQHGQGVDQDYNKAFKYFEKAANIGSSKSAMYNVDNCYRNGIGTKRDIQSANYWFRKYKSLLKTNRSPDHINPELKRILDDERFKLSWIDYKEINDTWLSVALKVIHNSNEHDQEFIQELKNHCEIGYENPSFLDCIGVSINDDGDYIIVMGIAPRGSLRQNLVEVSQLEWNDKLTILNGIVIDLESIHAQKLVHRDLHSGNILQRDELQHACITDLGLSKNEKEGKICGILPYIAPEVLVGQPYTKASDIYSLG